LETKVIETSFMALLDYGTLLRPTLDLEA